MRSSTRQQIINRIPTPRFQTYLTEAGGNKDLALELYQWNIDVAAAVSGTLAIVEVALRDTLDLRLRQWNQIKTGDPEWITNPHTPLSHIVRPTPPPQWTNNPSRRPGDLYGKWWEEKAVRGMKDAFGNRTNPAPAHDDLVAALTFGTWRQLLPKPVSLGGRANAPQVQIWHEAINIHSTICPPGTGFNASAGTAYYWCSILLNIRNRASHLEPLLDISMLRQVHKIASRTVTAVWPGAEILITGPARIPDVIKKKP